MKITRIIIWNLLYLVALPTVAIAFLAGIFWVLHVRAFVHGWNQARK